MSVSRKLSFPSLFANGPIFKISSPDGSYTWKVISVSQFPDTKSNSTISPVRVNKESELLFPLAKLNELVGVPFTLTSTEAPFQPSP